MYYVYIVQCKDTSFYTGITTDLARRITEHNQSLRGAKYTRSRGPVRLVYRKEYPDRSTASVEESRIKSLSRSHKIMFIKNARKEYLAELRAKKQESRKEYLLTKEEARAIIVRDVERLNAHYGFIYGTIVIRNQKTRWGSCSKKKNLNFNYKLLFVTNEEREYVIIHELCHLKEMNHSKRFWNLVTHACPDHRRIRARLKARTL